MSSDEQVLNAANAKRRELYGELLRGRVSVLEYVAAVMAAVNEARAAAVPAVGHGDQA